MSRYEWKSKNMTTSFASFRTAGLSAIRLTKSQ